ncbi:MAG: hypothetical protein ACJASX_004310, partial [Limisphaerales bacterium]
MATRHIAVLALVLAGSLGQAAPAQETKIPPGYHVVGSDKVADLRR